MKIEGEKDKIQDRIFEFAYDMAFRDATMRKAFPKNGDSEELFRDRKEKCKDAAKNIVRGYIDDILYSSTRK